MRQEKCSLLACLSSPPHPAQGWETEPRYPRPDSQTPKGGVPHPWLGKHNLQRESPPKQKKKSSKTHGTATGVVKDLGWGECPARVSPWVETRRNSPSLPEILLSCPEQGEGLVRVRGEGRGRSPEDGGGAAGKAGPRGSPLLSRYRPAALPSPGDSGRVSRSRDQIPDRRGAPPGTPRWDSRRGLLPPISLRGLQLPSCLAELQLPLCPAALPLPYYTSQHAPRLSGPCRLVSFPRLPRGLHYS